MKPVLTVCKRWNSQASAIYYKQRQINRGETAFVLRELYPNISFGGKHAEYVDTLKI